MWFREKAERVFLVKPSTKTSETSKCWHRSILSFKTLRVCLAYSLNQAIRKLKSVIPQLSEQDPKIEKGSWKVEPRSMGVAFI
jgi:hypothetical protein